MQATTATEHEANYQSVIGLQPELMTEVVQGSAPPEDLLLLRKPLQLERHKGGAVLVDGDDGDTCILSWLAGQTISRVHRRRGAIGGDQRIAKYAMTAMSASTPRMIPIGADALRSGAAWGPADGGTSPRRRRERLLCEVAAAR